ncbi:MAG TPA: hypothetical protein VL327_03465 [Pyrinomonadaceae bacterium]|jgi:uncharacterized membrane protein|nr:hypothetical protein [Pyrinomonadaceae bacterium]
MANVMSHDAAISHADTVDETRADAQSPSYQAYQILRIAFTVAPIVAGLDKFMHVLTDWDKYLPSVVNNMLGGNGHAFMMVVGVIEIIAGVGVFLKPKIFAYIVGIWLLLIIVNLLMIPGYYDVALRDLGLSLGAFALARLSATYDK